MRYIMAEKNGEMVVAIWAKSQNLEYTTNPECTHRDYLKAKQISFDETISVGDVHIDTANDKIECKPLPWEGAKAAAPDIAFLTKKTKEYYAQYGSTLKAEIDADWVSFQKYQEWQKLAAKKYGYTV